MKTFCIAAIALACLWLTGCANPVTTSKIESDILLKTTTSWDGTPYMSYPRGQPELTLMKIRIPAHTVLNWHTHQFPTPLICSAVNSQSRPENPARHACLNKATRWPKRLASFTAV